MTTYTFNPNPKEQFVNYNDPTVWVGGVVPDSADAVVVIPTVTTTATGYVYYSYITQSGTYEADSVDIANNELTIEGSFMVAGDFSVGQSANVDDNGLLSVDTFENDGATLDGLGQLDASGLFTNDSTVDGDGLTLALAALTNNGTLQATSGNLTVAVQAGGFTNLSNGVLTGGVYQAYLGTLYLSVGGPITTDAANIVIVNGGDIDYFDSASEQYKSIETSLQSVAESGQLTLAQRTSDFPTLTVDGEVTLLSATLASANLVVGSTGQITDSGEFLNNSSAQGGTLSGNIVDHGTILAASLNGLQPTGDDLVIAGTLSGDSAIQIAPGLWGEAILRSGITFFDQNTGGGLELQGAVSDNVDFLGYYGTLIVDNPATFTGAIATDGLDDKIELPGVSLSSVVSYSYTQGAGKGVLTIDCGAVSYSFNFIGNFTKSDFTLAAGPQVLSTSPPSLLISNSGTPTFTFTSFSLSGLTMTVDGAIDAADAGQPVSLYDGSTFLETVATGANGQFSATATLAETAGLHAITARATDAAGNAGVSDPIDFTINFPLVTITSPGGTTNQATQTITGTIDPADAGLTVYIYDNESLLGTATPLPSGDWSATVTVAEGVAFVTAQATDAAGHVGTSNEVIYQFDPVPPTVTITDTSELPDSTMQTLAGTIDSADAGLTISIYDGATLLTTTMANSAGSWTATVDLAGGSPHILTAQATNSYNQTAVSNMADLAVGGGQAVGLTQADDAASLYNTGGDFDIVGGVSGTIYLTSAQVESFNPGSAIDFAGGSGNIAAIYDTGGVWDLVNGSNGEVVLSDAFAEVTGGGNSIYLAGGSGNDAALYNTGANWDFVYGDDGVVVLSNAYAVIIGGGEAIYAEGAGNIAALFNANVFDALAGSNGEVVLSNAWAEVIGGSNQIYLEGTGNIAAIYNTAGAADTINGANGEVVLSNSQAVVNGNGNAIYLFGDNLLAVSGSSDNIVVEAGVGQQAISGFDVASDKLQFSASDFASFQALQPHIAQSGANTTITLDANDAVTLLGVTASSLTKANFNLV